MTVYLQAQREAEWAQETNAFIAKTYRLFVLSLMAGAGAAWVGLQLGLGMAQLLPLLGANLVILIFAFCVRRVRIANFIALFAFAAASGLSLSLVLGWMMRVGYGGIIMPAFLLTVTLFTLLSIYVHLKQSDFSCWGGFLFAGLCIMLAGWGFHTTFPAVALHTLAWAGAGIWLFAGYILMDTSLIIHHLGPDDAVQGALSLYLDVFLIFYHILRGLLEIVASFLTRGVDGSVSGADVFDFFDFSDFGDF